MTAPSIADARAGSIITRMVAAVLGVALVLVVALQTLPHSAAAATSDIDRSGTAAVVSETAILPMFITGSILTVAAIAIVLVYCAQKRPLDD